MPMIDSILAELNHEAANTRRLLERVPEDRLDFRPHEKSMTLQHLAGHLAEIPGWAGPTLGADELDFAAGNYETFLPKNREELLAAHDRAVETFRRHAEGMSDEQMMATWTLRNGDDVLMQQPRVVAVRGFILNHALHHRGQLTVYLRLLDVPLPALYGNSADESAFGS